ncbi:scarecrow-like protein 11 [Humulus lupulus]|uniref:scarecrow-like protein 11 n=1 Tax=Humulus lupulus TaxID=3486 RepID=UPI002B41344E|nr:scarecrow-like protein 11 [Humulus lupulus]
MDTLFEELLVSSMNDFNFNQGTNQNIVESRERSPHETNHPQLSDSSQSLSLVSVGDSPGSTSTDSFNATLKYLSEILMEEEDLERKFLILEDPLALQAAEKPFYDVLGQNYPLSSNKGANSSSDSGSRFNTHLSQDSVSDHVQSVDHFRRTGEASSFCYMGNTQIFDLESLEYNVPDEPKGKRSLQREYGESQEESRKIKQSGVYSDDSEAAEMFDRVLLYQDDSTESTESTVRQKFSQNDQAKGSGRKARFSKKRDYNKKETVDLWTLLTHCAEAVAGYDQRTATEQLRRIRQHSSPRGDATQRLAHYFANGFEARLTGKKVASYSALISSEMSFADILKAYQVYITACPFYRMTFSFANQTIKKLAKNVKNVHIIDFGILYGFQWPELIQRLSQTPGGPPKLRITGIEIPQPGFRPSEKVEETKRRLDNYCERFNVPSEYTVIAQKWETIRYEDLNIDRDRDELVVVNCLYRLKHIPDETVVMNNPRDTVLKLIRRISPDLFIHGVVNGTYSAPFFMTRFKEALFHYSPLFDMFDTTVPRQEEYRLKFEKAVYGRDIENVIACEGLDRVERPETYRQWQVRNTRAGFKPIPLDQEIFEAVKNSVHTSYDHNFVIERHGEWLLQGWKGRRIYCLSFWKPT